MCIGTKQLIYGLIFRHLNTNFYLFTVLYSGFWEAYEHVREFIHAILRRELSRNPTTVFFTGHSLGGALATFAALDVTLHTVPRVNAWLKHQER